MIEMKLKKTIRRMLAMCPEAWYIFITSVRLTAFLLVCTFLLLMSWNGSLLEGYTQYMTARALYETGQALLLIGAVFSVCIEDAALSRK